MPFIRISRVARLLPALVAVVLYLPTLGFDRTYDDTYHVARPGEAPVRTLGEVWSGPFLHLEGQSGGLFRPIVSTTFWLESRLDVPLGARHALNVALHSVVTFLLGTLLGSLGVKDQIAIPAAMLFALHPAHVEAVAGLVGRTELLAALFLLIALILHDRESHASPAISFSRAAGLSFLAAGSKEHAWTLPLLAGFLDVSRGRRPSHRSYTWLGYAVGIGLHLTLRMWVLGGLLDEPGARIAALDNPLIDRHGAARVTAGLGMVALNLTHLLLPLRLAPDWSGPQIDLADSMTDGAPAAGLFLMAVLGCVTLVGLFGNTDRRERATGCGAAWLLISAILFMNLWLSLGTIFADRVLYWPSVALIVLLAGGATWLEGAAPAVRPIAIAAVAMLGAFYAIRSATYLPAWKDDATLFSTAVAVAPKSPRIWLNLAQVRRDSERIDEAVAAAHRARTLAPLYEEAWGYEGAMLLLLGRPTEAAGSLEEALRLDPNDVSVWSNLGVARLQEERIAEAIDCFREVLSRDPAATPALLGLAEAEAARGRYDAAAGAWRRYLAIVPDDIEVQDRLARTLAAELGRASDEANRILGDAGTSKSREPPAGVEPATH